MAILWVIGRLSPVHKLKPRDSRHFPQAPSAAFQSQSSPQGTLRRNHNFVLLQYRGYSKIFSSVSRVTGVLRFPCTTRISCLCYKLSRIANCADILPPLVQPLLQNHGCCFAIDRTLILRHRNPCSFHQFLCLNRSQALVHVL